MKWNAAHTVSAMVALALAALLAGQAHAACGGSQKMSYQSAECLRADIRKVRNGETVEVQNMCSDHGQVVAKIDRKIQADLILYLGSGNTAEQSATKVNGVYCCKDLSDLCNRSDVVNDDSCLDQFRDSPAITSGNCKWESAHATGNYKCEVATVCRTVNGDFPQLALKMRVNWPNAARINYCNGGIKVGEC